MLRFLASRESGALAPDCLPRAECTRRALSLELSRHYVVKPTHQAGVNVLDLDLVERRYLLSGSADGSVAIHDMLALAGEPRYTYPLVAKIDRKTRGGHKFSVEAVQWYPLDTGMFTTSSRDHLLKVWDTNQLTVADEYEFNGNIYSHDMSQISLQHCLIAVAGQSSKVRLIDLKSGAATHVLRDHRKPVLCVKWSTRDEYILATGSEDNRVLIWDIRSAKGSMITLDQHNGDTTAGPLSANTAHNGLVNGICFTPDGLNLLTLGTDNRLRLWSTLSGANTNVHFAKIDNESRKCVHLSVSEYTSPQLAFVPHDSHIQILSLDSGESMETLRGHYNQVNACLYEPDKQELFSAGNDRNILVWTPMTSAVEAFDNHLASQKAPVTHTTNFVQRVGTMVDTWSSDEDD